MEDRYVKAATILLQGHYDAEEAATLADALNERWEQDPMALITVTTVMSLQPEPWWESEDPMVRAIQQLECETMLLKSFDALIDDVETCLERSLGDTPEQKQQTLFMRREHLLCELKGEDPPAEDPMQALMAQLMGGGMPMPLPEGYDDFGAPEEEA